MKYTSNSVDVMRKYREAQGRALQAVGVFVNGEAVVRCPVDTGNLRSSITHVVGDDHVIIGSNVDYAPYVELGTQHQVAQPYLYPAVVENRSRLESLVRQYFRL